MLTQNTIQEWLDYDVDTGIFKWKKSPSMCVKQSSIAGTLNKSNGYIIIQLSRKVWKAHRLAWLYVYGCMPNHHIDHIDGNRANNAIANLRDVTNAQNQQNQKIARNDNSTGFLGVSYRKETRKFRARIGLNGVIHNIGNFDTASDAHDAYITVKRLMHEYCEI